MYPSYYFSSIPAISVHLLFWAISFPLHVHSKEAGKISLSSTSLTERTITTFFEDDTFIINLIKQEKFSECSVMILQDNFDNGQSVDRIIESVSSFPSFKTAYSIKYNFLESTSEPDNDTSPRSSRLNLVWEKLADDGNKTKTLMSPTETFPVRFPISVSNFRTRSSPCLVVILMVNDLRPKFHRQIYSMITPVYIPITRKDEDYYIFKTQPRYHEKLLLMQELPNRIKFKIAVGLNNKQNGTGVNVNVRTVCFFCEPGGKPRLLQLPVTEQNLPVARINYFPDFVWDLNGKLLYVSLPYIRAKIEADPPWEGTFNARRGNWKNLFEDFLTVKFNFTYNMFVSTGLDGGKGGGGTGLQLRNGTWIGVTGDLISGKADLGIVIANTPKRIYYIDFTDSFYDVGCLTFVTARPIRIYSPAAFLWPFDLGMWTGIGLSTLLSIIFFFSFFKIMEIWQFGNGESWSFSVQIQFLLSTFLEQDSPVLPESLSIRCFVVLWIFFTMVLTNVYRSKMVTLLAFPVVAELPKTFEELAFSDYQVGFMKHGDSAYNTLAASTDPVYVKLVAEMEIFSGVGLECLEKVLKYKYGCIAYDFAMFHLRERNLSDADTRHLVFAPARTYNIWLGLGTEGKSIYRLNFSKMLSYTRQFHLADIWDKMDMYYNVRLLKRRWWERTGQMDKMRHVVEASDNLTLKHIAGAFYVLIVALSISTIVFLQEFLTSFCDHAINNVLSCMKTLREKVNKREITREIEVHDSGLIF